jgi:hypothetical protein
MYELDIREEEEEPGGERQPPTHEIIAALSFCALGQEGQSGLTDTNTDREKKDSKLFFHGFEGGSGPFVCLDAAVGDGKV